MQLRIHHHLARDRVMVLDQRPGIVEQNLLGHTAKGPEAAFHAVEPMLLAFATVSPGVQPAGIAERGDEEEYLLHPVPDRDTPLAEVDLQLLTGRRLHRLQHRARGPRHAAPAAGGRPRARPCAGSP